MGDSAYEVGVAGIGALEASIVFRWPFGAKVPTLQLSECGVNFTTLPLTEETSLPLPLTSMA